MVQGTLPFRGSIATRMDRVWEQNGCTRREADAPVPVSSYRRETTRVHHMAELDSKQCKSADSTRGAE